MKRQLLLALCLLSVAGCAGLSGESATPTPVDDDPWKHRIVVENGYDAPRTFTVTLATESGRSVVNESHRVDAGEQWVATTLTESAHGDGAYVLTISTAEDGRLTSSPFDATPQDGVTYTSGATLYVFSPSSSEVHVCGENVTCYEHTAD
ncbi:hypothetical protein [Halogranum rubrum]|uniref:Uncharacterized protein n=1 Tax=Halogranum salarium B-1 TaxID=1210908 RepID=J3A7P5_9EURY|nr:hypothetical protein [Halogranum salarium]EJN61648.1 hypothetical protein HSB1_00150 [Halogranum salarium B-1]